MKIMKSLKHWKGGKDDVDGKRGGEAARMALAT